VEWQQADLPTAVPAVADVAHGPHQMRVDPGESCGAAS
jgi:hypothetical protein